MMLLTALTKLVFTGIGIWGNNNPVGWGFDIINFVWWIGIGHAGTLISAILLLLRQEWRTSINRFAEAMTLFAVACALLFPLFHTGRPWLAVYWLLPYPNTMAIWPNFRSPLIWDVFAVSTYGAVSLLFWFIGLVPDLATFRDRTKKLWQKKVYGALAMGWRGSARHWHNYESAYLLLAGLSTPLVLSVHSVVSFDFASGQVPGWHATIFPPYFVAGAVFAGFAMVLTLMIPLRKAFGLEDFITMKHMDNMGKVMLVTGLIVGYGYIVEIFTAWYSGNIYEWYMIRNRIFGPYKVIWMSLILCNVLAIQPLWFRKTTEVDRRTLDHLDVRQLRNVVRTLRDHSDLAAPRLPARLLGHVLPDPLGFRDLLRHDRPVHGAHVPLRARLPGDRHVRDEGAHPRRQSQGARARMTTATPPHESPVCTA